VHEVLSVVRRADERTCDVPGAGEHIKASGIAVLPLSDEVVAEAAAQCDALGCSFYDALAPACASSWAPRSRVRTSAHTAPTLACT
jgi:hypothetical protein